MGFNFNLSWIIILILFTWDTRSGIDLLDALVAYLQANS